MLLVCHFTHKTWKRVDLFPILTTNDSSIFLSNSVNHGQGSMCLKFKPLFLYKQHPIDYSSDDVWFLYNQGTATFGKKSDIYKKGN